MMLLSLYLQQAPWDRALTPFSFRKSRSLRVFIPTWHAFLAFSREYKTSPVPLTPPPQLVLLPSCLFFFFIRWLQVI